MQQKIDIGGRSAIVTSIRVRHAKHKKVLLALCEAIVDIVQSGGEQGVPGGTLYAALMAHGCTLEQFEGIMRALVTMSKVEKRGQLYFGRGS